MAAWLGSRAAAAWQGGGCCMAGRLLLHGCVAAHACKMHGYAARLCMQAHAWVFMAGRSGDPRAVVLHRR